MIVKLLTEHHLKFLSLRGGCRDSSESTLVKIPHCWKSRATAQKRTKTFLTLLYVTFSCVFVTFPYGVLGQVWYLIVLIPDLCFPPFFSCHFSIQSINFANKLLLLLN